MALREKKEDSVIWTKPWVGRTGFMTGFYMGHRLDTVGTQDPAQILLTVFHMAFSWPIVPFQAQVHAPL